MVISVSSNVKQEIRTAINSGKVVIIPETEITINQWNGVGYMVLDTDTFACGYMISGGTAGGAMSAFEVIDRYIDLVANGILTIITYELAKAAVLALLPFGWVATAFTIAEITMLSIYVGNIVNLFIQFKNTGKVEYLQEALIEIAAGLTIAAIMPSIKSDLEQMKADVTDLVNSLKSQPEYPTTPGGCFIAGTLISTPKGFVPIENIKSGDVVWSFDSETLEVSQNYVDQVLVHKSNDLVKITIGNEIITATSNHPFYVVTKGFISALDLRAGDILITVHGERVVVEKVQHEILEAPVDVYNFNIRKNHTYFVGTAAVGVHNAGGPCMDNAGYDPSVSDGAKTNSLPKDNPSQMGHIFNDNPGHLPNTPENQALIEDLINDGNCKLGPDQYGNDWFGRIMEDGNQLWAECRNGRVIDGGLSSPRSYNPQTGLKNPNRGW